MLPVHSFFRISMPQALSSDRGYLASSVFSLASADTTSPQMRFGQSGAPARSLSVEAQFESPLVFFLLLHLRPAISLLVVTVAL